MEPSASLICFSTCSLIYSEIKWIYLTVYKNYNNLRTSIYLHQGLLKYKMITDINKYKCKIISHIILYIIHIVHVPRRSSTQHLTFSCVSTSTESREVELSKLPVTQKSNTGERFEKKP